MVNVSIEALRQTNEQVQYGWPCDRSPESFAGDEQGPAKNPGRRKLESSGLSPWHWLRLVDSTMLSTAFVSDIGVFRYSATKAQTKRASGEHRACNKRVSQLTITDLYGR